MTDTESCGEKRRVGLPFRVSTPRVCARPSFFALVLVGSWLPVPVPIPVTHRYGTYIAMQHVIRLSIRVPCDDLSYVTTVRFVRFMMIAASMLRSDWVSSLN